MKDAHTKELAASAETHAIDLAKQRRGLKKSAHEALLKEKLGHDEIVGKLEAAHAQNVQVKIKDHNDFIARLSAIDEAALVSKEEEYKAAIEDVVAREDAKVSDATAELEAIESAHKAAIVEAAIAHRTELNELKGAHNDSIDNLTKAHKEQLEEIKSKHAQQLANQRMIMEAAAAKTAEEIETHMSPCERLLKLSKQNLCMSRRHTR